MPYERNRGDKDWAFHHLHNTESTEIKTWLCIFSTLCKKEFFTLHILHYDYLGISCLPQLKKAMLTHPQAKIFSKDKTFQPKENSHNNYKIVKANTEDNWMKRWF
jgi:hypothetical protein